MRKITEGCYIDLGDLLPEALEWAFERSAEDKAPDKDRLRKFPVANITDWVLAFATYMIWQSPSILTHPEHFLLPHVYYGLSGLGGPRSSLAVL